jgi:serine/threonine protein kinase
MIDMNGNLKIADFGLSKEGLKPNELATTYCGSPEYMAPEMLAKYHISYSELVIPTQSTTTVWVLFSTSW